MSRSVLEILQNTNAGGNLVSLNLAHQLCRKSSIPTIPASEREEKRARYASLSTKHKELLNLNISSKYCAQNPAWTVHAGLRELIQNWRDQIVKTIGDFWKVEITSSDGSECYVAYTESNGNSNDDTSKKLIGGFILECYEKKSEDTMSSIYLVNYATELADSALTIGLSTKVGASNMIGSHGEGMKVGINRLLTKGVHIGVLTRGQDWRFSHVDDSLHLIRRETSGGSWDPNHPFYPLVDSTTCFVVQGFPGRMRVEDYLFLNSPKILSDPNTYVVKSASIEAQIFLNKYVGKVFVKGILVEEKEELKFKYGGLGMNIIQGIPLDRDRSIVEPGRLAFIILQLFKDIQKTLHPDQKAMKWRRIPTHDEAAISKANGFVTVIYKEIENYEVGDKSIIPTMLEKLGSNPAFCECIYKHFLKQHDVDPVEDKKRDVPLVLPVNELVSRDDLQEYQYFLGLPIDKIVKCHQVLLKVLYAYKLPKPIEEYILMFWDKVTNLPDYEIATKHPEFLKWVGDQIENTLKGILKMDMFQFKTLPSREVPHMNMNASAVRAVKDPSGDVRGVIVDCDSLFSSCKCQTSTGCTKNCVKATFLTSLKSSLFRNDEDLRENYEQQMQDYMIKLTTRSSDQTASSGDDGDDDDHDCESDDESAMEEEEETDVEIDLSRFFFLQANPLPSQIQSMMSTVTHSTDKNGGCHATSLNLVMTFKGMSIYIDPELVGSNSSLSSPVNVQQLYKQELESCVQHLQTIFRKLGQQAMLPHCGVFLSASTHLRAFNRGGQLFFNALADKATSLLYDLDLDRLLSFWFVIICHQAAHNLYPTHGKSHEHAMERLMSHLIPLVWKSSQTETSQRNAKIQHFYNCVVLNSRD